MNERRRLLRLYPQAWRDRYGDEVRALMEDLEGDDDLRAADLLDLLRHGVGTRRRSLSRGAVVALASSFVAFGCIGGGLVLSGVLSPPPHAQSVEFSSTSSGGCTLTMDVRTGAVVRMQGPCPARGGAITARISHSGKRICVEFSRAGRVPAATGSTRCTGTVVKLSTGPEAS